MKRVFKGWVGKSCKLKDVFYWDNPWDDFRELKAMVSNTRGLKRDWLDEDWPPRKVIITVDIKEDK